MDIVRFNPLHYGEGFLTLTASGVLDWASVCFNPLHYGEGFLTKAASGMGMQFGLVSIPCITGRVS